MVPSRLLHRQHCIFVDMDLKDITEKALKVSLEAAAFIRSQAGKVATEDIITKSENSLVSYVDKTAEEILVKGLGEILPAAGFITEEETVAQQTSAYTWIIDPLDGTTNFLQQLPFYAVSVGLVHHGEIIVGIVIDAAHSESFYAWKGGGAWCNGESISVSPRTKLEESIVATGFPYASSGVLSKLNASFEYFLRSSSGLRRLGSAALDLAYVACGRFDMYYETSLNAWDVAGGIILVEEAGGTVSDFAGQRNMLPRGEVIAAPPAIHTETLSQIKAIWGT